MTAELENHGIDWTQWHTVRCEWSPEAVTLSIDGKQVSYKDASYVPATSMRMIHQEPPGLLMWPPTIDAWTPPSKKVTK